MPERRHKLHCCGEFLKFVHYTALAVILLLGTGSILLFAKETETVAWTNKVLCITVATYKVCLGLFIICGGLTLLSAVHANPDLTPHWNWKGIHGLFQTKHWQSRGFILQPLSVGVGVVLFVTKNVLSEGIYSGAKLPKHQQCYFDHQESFIVASLENDFTRVEGMSKDWNSIDNMKAAFAKCGYFETACIADEINLSVTSYDVSWLQWHVMMFNKAFLGRPPSKCYDSDKIMPLPSVGIPTSDFPSGISQTKHIKRAPTYFGSDYFGAQKKLFFADIETECFYVCTKPASKSPVQFVLDLGIILGGGVSIVLGANMVGKRVGIQFVTADTGPHELAGLALGDLRVLLPLLWAQHCKICAKPYRWKVLQRILLLFVKSLGLVFAASFYRPYIEKWTHTYADRCVVHCIFWLGLWVVVLRSCFVFTEEMWHSGKEEDCVMKTAAGVSLATVDLYSWLRMHRASALEFLSDYIRRVGNSELNTNQPMRVEAATHIKAKDYFSGVDLTISAGTKGTIEKEDGRPRLEGLLVIVTWDTGKSCGADRLLLRQVEGKWSQLDEIKAIMDDAVQEHELDSRDSYRALMATAELEMEQSNVSDKA